MPLSPGDKLGPHTILALVGRGGMGEVYRAHDDRLRRDVAIKVSRDQFTERFTREARAIASLNHTNICHLYDVGPNYLVMEYVEGEDLNGPLSFDEALPIVRQLIDGIEAAHEKNVIHRDLKPGNVKITPEGVVKILDFGLAKAAEEAAGDPSESPTLTMGGTAAGTILGTAAYMAPEQAKGKPVDKRADIFSFGVVVYELLTGQNPFKGESVVESLGAILNKEPDWSAVPARAERLLRWCLQKDRKSRLGSISNARTLLDEPVAAAEPVTVVQVQKEPASKLPWLVAAAALIGAAALAFWPQPVPELHALRYNLDPPKGFQFTNIFGAGTPSPDGRFIVFSALPADATNTGATTELLWLRPTDSLDARPLPGTEGGNVPFWSPDGKSIGFWTQSDRKLKRVEAVGGAPQVLCDAANFEGGTWSKDGVILFSAGNIIQRVAAAGGKAEPVTKISGRPGESHRDPQFLPDGQGFLYRMLDLDEKIMGIHAATLTKPDVPVQLVKGTNRKAAYAPPFAGRPGYLLWLRDQTLVAQRFDATALKLEGDPVPVAEEVALQTGSGTRRAAYWISQNGLLAYRTGVAAGGALQMTWISRDGKQRESVGKGDDFANDFRLSPDGKHVALGRTVSGNQDIWLYEFERGVMSRLTFDPAVEGAPVWSPDSRQLAYASLRAGPPQLFRKDAGGGGQAERLHESPLPEEPKDWSRDGKFLLYMSTDPKTLSDQWLLPMDGTAPRKPVVVLQTPANEGRSRISPDGKWVAYASGDGNQVYIRATPGGPAGQWQVSNAGGDYPRWRGDGKEVFFHSSGRETVMAAGIKLLADRVEIETPRELFTYVGPNQSYEPTADGQRFLVLTAPGTNDGEARAVALKIISNWQALLK